MRVFFPKDVNCSFLMMGSAHFLINDHMELLSVLEFWKDIRNPVSIIQHLSEAY